MLFVSAADVSTVETNLVIMTILASVGGVIVIAFFMICVVAIRRRSVTYRVGQ